MKSKTDEQSNSEVMPDEVNLNELSDKNYEDLEASFLTANWPLKAKVVGVIFSITSMLGFPKLAQSDAPWFAYVTYAVVSIAITAICVKSQLKN